MVAWCHLQEKLMCVICFSQIALIILLIPQKRIPRRMTLLASRTTWGGNKIRRNGTYMQQSRHDWVSSYLRKTYARIQHKKLQRRVGKETRLFFGSFTRSNYPCSSHRITAYSGVASTDNYATIRAGVRQGDEEGADEGQRWKMFCVKRILILTKLRERRNECVLKMIRGVGTIKPSYQNTCIKIRTYSCYQSQQYR